MKFRWSTNRSGETIEHYFDHIFLFIQLNITYYLKLSYNSVLYLFKLVKVLVCNPFSGSKSVILSILDHVVCRYDGP